MSESISEIIIYETKKMIQQGYSEILNESIFILRKFIYFTFFRKMSLKLKTIIDSYNINIYKRYINTEKVKQTRHYGIQYINKKSYFIFRDNFSEK